MKKIFLIISLFFLLFPVTCKADQLKTGVNQIAQPIYPYPGFRFPGENQFYSVNLRGNGETVITAKFIFTNVDNPLQTVMLQFPTQANPQDVLAYQILQEPNCIRYLPLENSLPNTQNNSPLQPPCMQFQEPNYQYIYSTAKYQRIPLERNDNSVTLHLPNVINHNGAYFLYYRSFGYTKKNIFGAYDFNFETIKVKNTINSLTVGLSTDSDYFIRGPKADVNFPPRAANVYLPMSQITGSATVDPSFGQYYGQIGQGTITKTASQLQAMDSYSVKGSYADSKIKLYGKEIVISSFSILIIIIALIVIIRVFIIRLSRKFNKEKLSQNISISNAGIFSLSALLSFVSIFLLTLYSFCIIFFMNYFTGILSSQLNMLIILFLLMTSFVVYAFLFISPAVIIYFSKGIQWSIITFGLTICWTIVFLFISAGILFIFFKPNSNQIIQPFPLPMLKTNLNGVSSSTNSSQ